MASEVIAYDGFAKSLENAQERIPAYAADLVSQGLMTAAEVEPTLARITYTLNPEDGALADLISESVLEDPRTERQDLYPVQCDLSAPHPIHHQYLDPATLDVRRGDWSARQIRRLAFLWGLDEEPGRYHAPSLAPLRKPSPLLMAFAKADWPSPNFTEEGISGLYRQYHPGCLERCRPETGLC